MDRFADSRKATVVVRGGSRVCIRLVYRFDNLNDLQSKRLCEFKVTLVVGRDGHNSTRSITRQT